MYLLFYIFNFPGAYLWYCLRLLAFHSHCPYSHSFLWNPYPLVESGYFYVQLLPRLITIFQLLPYSILSLDRGISLLVCHIFLLNLGIIIFICNFICSFPADLFYFAIFYNQLGAFIISKRLRNFLPSGSSLKNFILGK